MRYEKYVLNEYTTVRHSSDINELEELHVIHHDVSDVDQYENRNQCKLIEALYYTLVELFDVHNLEMQTTGEAISLFLINKDEGEVMYGVNSPWLSREKLKAASAKEISGAMIDLILHRDKWTNEVTYRVCHLFD